MQFVRMVVFGFIALSVIYVCVKVYSRSVRKEKLEKAFAEAHPDGDLAARDVYVREGLAEYDASIRPKLIGLVYVVPVIAVSVILYMVN